MGSILYYSNMTIFCLYLSFILAVTTAQKDGGQIPPPPPPGLCLDPRMMSAVCTINTEIGSKMEQAHLQCAAAAQVQERKKKKNGKKNKGNGGKKGNGKGKKCDVDLDTLDEFFADVWQKKACILKKVGWVTQEGEIAPEKIMAGIATLDPRLSEGLSDTEELCGAEAANVTIESMFSGEDFVQVEIQAEDAPLTADDDCKVEKLDEEKVASIEKSLKKLSYVACVHGNFMTACGNFILDQMSEIVQYMTEGGFTSLPAKNTTTA